MLKLIYFTNFMQKLIFPQLEYEQRFGMCGKRAGASGVCGVAGWFAARIYASHCGLAGIVARTKTSTKLAHRRGDIMAPVSHFTARATTGAGLPFSMCIWSATDFDMGTTQREREREREGEKGMGIEKKGESWAKTFPCCAHTHKKHEFVFCSAVDAAGQ